MTLLWVIWTISICFVLNKAQYTKSCDTSCWCEGADVVGDYCDDSCSVDCADAIGDACYQTFDSVYVETMDFAIQAFNESDGDVRLFERLFNDTFYKYIEEKHQQCKDTTNTSNRQNHQYYIFFVIVVLVIVFGN